MSKLFAREVTRLVVFVCLFVCLFSVLKPIPLLGSLQAASTLKVHNRDIVKARGSVLSFHFSVCLAISLLLYDISEYTHDSLPNVPNFSAVV